MTDSEFVFVLLKKELNAKCSCCLMGTGSGAGHGVQLLLDANWIRSWTRSAAVAWLETGSGAGHGVQLLLDWNWIRIWTRSAAVDWLETGSGAGHGVQLLIDWKCGSGAGHGVQLLLDWNWIRIWTRSAAVDGFGALKWVVKATRLQKLFSIENWKNSKKCWVRIFQLKSLTIYVVEAATHLQSE